jgi:phage host-nuclease inhibitor protein Gam
MSIAVAIKKNAEPLGVAQTTYKENVGIVNTYVNQVLSSKVPQLKEPPKNWSQFLTTYENAGAEALTWVNGVMARLINVPGEVDDYNSSISLSLSDAKSQANTLVSEPGNAAALRALEADLKAVTTQLGTVTTYIGGALKKVEEFSDTMPELAKNLESLAHEAMEDSKVDQTKINALNAEVESLRDEIKSLTGALVGLGIADGVALTMGIAITIAAWPVGAVAWLVLGPIVAVATTFIAIDAQKITAAKAKIEADQREMGDLEADVATLKLLSGSYGSMVRESETIETSLAQVLAAWRLLEGDVVAAVTDVQTAIADADSKAFGAVEKEIVEAISEWDAAYAAAGGLALEIDVNPAPLTLGMSAEEVKNTLAGGKSSGLIEYYNDVGAALAA